MSATATLPVTETDVEETGNGFSHEEFVTHMKAMAAHYKGNPVTLTGATHAYALPVHMTHVISPTGVMRPAPHATPAGKQALDSVLQQDKSNTTNFAQQQHDFVQAQTNKVQASHDTSSFAAAMNAQRQKAKQDSDAHIDDTYNKLINIGTQHPELQSQILSVTQKIGLFFTTLLANVGAFFTNIYNKIVGWINSAVDWIKGAAQTAAKWLSGAVSTIGSFFSSIF